MAKKTQVPSLEKAKELLKEESWHKAVEVAMAILENDLNASQAMFIAGVAHGFIGQFGKAQELLEKALQYDPENFEAWFYLGRAYFQSWKYIEAVRCYRKASELKPGDLETLFQLGRSLRQANQVEDAIKNFQHVIDIAREPKVKSDDIAEKANDQLEELGIKYDPAKGMEPNFDGKKLPMKALNEILLRATSQKDLKKVKYAIEKGADVNVLNSQGRTALLGACDHGGSLEIAKYLIEHGADVNFQQEDRETPLTYASMYGKLDHVKLLIDSGADVNKKGGYGRTPLHFAATGGEWTEYYPEITELLLKSGADPNLYHDGGDTPLLEATWRDEFTVELAQILIDNGADVKIKSKVYNDTALERASASGRLDLVEVLQNALSKTDHKKSIEEIQKSIIEALKKEKKDVVWFMLKQNCDLLDKEFFFGSFLEYVVRRGYMDILEYLMTKDIDFSTRQDRLDELLIDASYENQLDMVKFLIKQGADVNGGEYGAAENPLMEASRHESIELADFLLERGANIEAKDYRGNRPMHFAAWEGKLEMLRFLLSKGAEIDAKNNLNWTPLMQACLQGYFHLVNFLLSEGANVNVIDEEKGASVLILAVHANCYECVRLLLEHGADKTIKDKEGKSATQYAQEKGYTNLLELIDSY